MEGQAPICLWGCTLRVKAGLSGWPLATLRDLEPTQPFWRSHTLEHQPGLGRAWCPGSSGWSEGLWCDQTGRQVTPHLSTSCPVFCSPALARSPGCLPHTGICESVNITLTGVCLMTHQKASALLSRADGGGWRQKRLQRRPRGWQCLPGVGTDRK